MSKVTISPLLKSLFSRTSFFTKEEAEGLLEPLSQVGDETYRVSLAQATGRKFKGLNYLTVSARREYDSEVMSGFSDVLENNGFTVRYDIGGNRGGDGYWIFFSRK